MLLSYIDYANMAYVALAMACAALSLEHGRQRLLRMLKDAEGRIARAYLTGWRNGVESVWVNAHGFTTSDGEAQPALGFEVAARLAARHAENQYRRSFGVPMQEVHGMSVFDQKDADGRAAQ